VVIVSMLGLIGNRCSGTTGERADESLRFEENLGQFDARVSYVARGAGYFLSLSPHAVQFELQRRMESAADSEPFEPASAAPAMERARLTIGLLGADSAAIIKGQGKQPGTVNYFIGNDASRWRTGVPCYDRVRVSGVYPGIDLVHYGNQQRLEYDFEISPGVSPQSISMQFRGVAGMELAANGELVIHLGQTELRQPRPVAFQIIAGIRKEVRVDYRLVGADVVQFALGNYDPGATLVIDPIMGYSSYFHAPGDDRPWSVAVGPGGDVYLAGETMSTSGLVTSGAVQTNFGGTFVGHGDVFVARLTNSASLVPVYATYLGGKAHDVGFGLAVDSDGNAVVTGYTASSDFPVYSAIQTNIAGPIPSGFQTAPLDCFLSKIGPFGSNLVFSTYFGGSGAGAYGLGDDVGYGVALDGDGNIFVTGTTYSTNFPVANTASISLHGLQDAFVAKFGPAGTNLIYSMYLGGANADYGRSVAVAPNGNPVVAGYTLSSDFPVTATAVQRDFNQSTNLTVADDGFVVRLQPNLGLVDYSSFLGGANADRALAVAVDQAGAAYVAGWTQSGDFLGFQTNFPAAVVSNVAYPDAFVSKIDFGSTNLAYSAVFGGADREVAWGVAVDVLGQVHVTGETASLDFPTNAVTGFLQATNSGGIDAFLAELNAAGTAFLYSGYMGGSDTDRGYHVALDPAGNSYFVGETIYGNFPTSTAVSSGSDMDSFLVKLLVPPALHITSTNGAVELTWPGYSTEFGLESNPDLLNAGTWVPVANATLVAYTNGHHLVQIPATNSPTYFRLHK